MAYRNTPTTLKLLALVIVLGPLSFDVVGNEVPSTQDCDEWFRLALEDPNLTIDERQALYDELLLIELADVKDCSSSSSSSSNASDNGIGVAVSPNALAGGGQSVAVAGTVVSSVDGDHESVSTGTDGNSSVGKSHEELENADNRARLAKQILARAEAETDPKIKATLMVKYRELSK